MRSLLGGLLALLALFAVAVLWQKRWTSAARYEREAARGDGEDAPGWSRVIVGRPSGDEPAPAPPAAAPQAPATAPQPASPAAVARSSSVHVVQGGETLSSICQRIYGSGRREIVLALAAYNRLANPDVLREGQEIRLPPLEELAVRRP